jgi:hypothetical protein
LGLGLATVNCQLVGLQGMIVSQASVAPHLTADRGLMDPHDRSNFGLAMTGFHERINLVAVFFGKLWVTQQCSSCLAVRKATILLQLAFYPPW